MNSMHLELGQPVYTIDIALIALIIIVTLDNELLKVARSDF